MKPLTTLAAAAALIAVGPLVPSPAAARTAVEAPASSRAPAVDAPRIPYRAATRVDFGGGNWRLVRPDGSRQRLGEANWSTFATLGRALVGSYGTEAGVAIEVVAPDGDSTTRLGFEHFGLVTTPDRSIVGFLRNDERFVSIEDAGRRRLTLSRVPGADAPGAVLGSGTCREDEPEGGGCTAFLNRPRNRGAVFTTSHGITDRVPRLARVRDVNQRGRVAGVTAADHRCSGVLAGARRIAWRTCDHVLESFSPDGRRLLGTRRSGGDVREVALYGPAGGVLASWAWARGTRVTGVTWEDSRHVLAVARVDGAWSILRLGVDGSAEDTVAPRRGSVDFPKFQLPLR